MEEEETLSDICPEVDKKSNALSLYELYGQPIPQEPISWDNGINNFGRPFLCLHYYILSSYSNTCRYKYNSSFKIYPSPSLTLSHPQSNAYKYRAFLSSIL